jgi:hypothetical protein
MTTNEGEYVKYCGRRNLILACAITALFALLALAVDGISVTEHWEGSWNEMYGGLGKIWRYDIVDSKVAGSKVIYDGVVRNALIGPDGKQCAFIRNDGKICVMSIDGGAVKELASGHSQGCADWAGDWIWYSMGNGLKSGSDKIRRVNVKTGQDELYTDFPYTTWRFGISQDNTRMAVRMQNRIRNESAVIYAYDLAKNSQQMDWSRCTPENDFTCQESMSPHDYFTSGWEPHDGTRILRWDNLEEVGSVRWSDLKNWGPATGVDCGTNGNRNGWSVNSEKWLIACLGWYDRSARNENNQVLVNWRDKQKIKVTDNPKGSKKYNGAGDFFVLDKVDAGMLNRGIRTVSSAMEKTPRTFDCRGRIIGPAIGFTRKQDIIIVQGRKKIQPTILSR